MLKSPEEVEAGDEVTHVEIQDVTVEQPSIQSNPTNAKMNDSVANNSVYPTQPMQAPQAYPQGPPMMGGGMMQQHQSSTTTTTTTANNVMMGAPAPNMMIPGQMQPPQMYQQQPM